ncbi:MAG: hypothetical protein ACRDSE_25130, partial [Pseudonocardiaceae bacterium]
MIIPAQSMVKLTSPMWYPLTQLRDTDSIDDATERSSVVSIIATPLEQHAQRGAAEAVVLSAGAVGSARVHHG